MYSKCFSLEIISSTYCIILYYRIADYQIVNNIPVIYSSSRLRLKHDLISLIFLLKLSLNGKKETRIHHPIARPYTSKFCGCTIQRR